MVSGLVFGASIGLGVQLLSNSLRKVPLMRDPWEHVLLIGLGGWAGKALNEYEERTSLKIEEMLEKRKHLRETRGRDS